MFKFQRGMAYFKGSSLLKRVLPNSFVANKINKFNNFNFSTKDDAFWGEYTQRKLQGGRVPALESQEIIYNKTVHSWKYAENHALTSEELLISLRELEPKSESPFVILDVREEVECDIYKIPKKNRKGSVIPIYYRDMKEINHGNYEDIPLSKYVICIDTVGLRGRMTARILANEGYLSLYVEGGYDMFIPLAKNKEF